MLAAGRGSRIGELTAQTHKSLLPIAGRPCLQRILDGILKTHVQEIVLVTGYKDGSLREFVSKEYGDAGIKFVHNPSFERDTNILSVDLGVDALSHPENGYLIVETDIVVEPEGWRQIMGVDPSGPSVWITRGSYSRELTGGALRSDKRSNVEKIIYFPNYDSAYEGWQKLLGLLFVGKAQAAVDRTLRKKAIRESIQQYYMTPWCSNLADLPCKALSLGTKLAYSFNNIDAYRFINSEYERIVQKEG